MELSPVLVISIMIGLIIVLVFVGAPAKPMRVIGQGTVRIAIGVLFLFFFNIIAGSFGLHIPINVFTVIISGFLGLFGIASLAAIHLIILP
ncbi:pro-sigmaK processing inhibitor BofA family protein [Ornithinibacillus halophilus]|uniref:Inhibitor of the pro-sigma K processing machinery n=1 Tax=Ornithinibacillus halophilus TaxID=930117 RepID=A0A1M5M0Y3_9BACI|nr:pro-sigmaK processing inhibitor BofA family protein [Ornithinibacillus halophilus]SHG71014.1 inhibitor of the pro-sigma K processing machinery [Ornithinibacillus halophilus]